MKSTDDIDPRDPDSIRRMFTRLAPDYDRLNVAITFGLLRSWRRELVDAMELRPGHRALDLCCGTGAGLPPLRRAVGASGLAVGVDFTPEMLRRASGPRALADAMRLPFPDGSFDAAVCAFALRDVADQSVVIAEMARVVRPGGRVGILEVGRPRGILRVGFDAWFRGVVPRVGAAFGQAEAFRFLRRSLAYLPERPEMERMLRDAGVGRVRWRALTLGAASMVVGQRERSLSSRTSAG